MHSCIYHGYTTHRRLRPVAHEFRYPVTWLYLVLDELEELQQRLWLLSNSKWGVASFQVADHLAAEQQEKFGGDLPRFIRKQVDEAMAKAAGPIGVLTPLRHFGFYFSPLSLFYCWDADLTEVTSVVAEVNNTPWRQKHWYVLGNANRRTAEPKSRGDSGPPDSASDQRTMIERFRHQKEFHVSPFMDMNQQYDWTVTQPKERLGVSIRSTDPDGEIFSAAMNLERRQLNNWSFAKLILRYPLLPYQILAAIYFEAFRLWRKDISYFPNPSTQ